MSRRLCDEPLNALTLRLRPSPAFLLGHLGLAPEFGLVRGHSRLASKHLRSDHSGDDHLRELGVEVRSPLVPASEVGSAPVRPGDMQREPKRMVRPVRRCEADGTEVPPTRIATS
jgi:hypothetical protein